MAKRKTKKRKLRARTIYCVEKEYSDFSTVLQCYTHKEDAKRVANANLDTFLRTKRLFARGK